MPDQNDLIATLQESLEQTKNALKRRLEDRAGLQKNTGAPAEELAEIEADIAVLKNSAEQTESAILSLKKRFQTGGFDVFDLGFKSGSGDSF